MKKEDMNITEVTFPSSDPSCRLSGDLALPSPSSEHQPVDETRLLPAIVVVAGSGPIDRDGNAPSLRLEFNTSNRFAEHVTNSSSRPADRAVAVLSYDKRGVGKSTNDDKNFYYRAGMLDFVADAVEAVRFAAGHPRIDKSKIILLGHSEGAIIMPLICREVSNDGGLDPIKGCIFYSGFGENLVDAMEFQRETIVNEVQEMTGPKGWILRKLITKERLEKQYEGFIKKVNAYDAPDFVSMQCGLAKQPAKWLREHIAYDANESLEKYVTCDCLAVTGMKDFQVRSEFCEPERAAKLVPNARSVEAHRPANLTHALRSMKGGGKMMNMKKDYSEMGKLPLDKELMLITDAWLDRILYDGEE